MLVTELFTEIGSATALSTVHVHSEKTEFTTLPYSLLLTMRQSDCSLICLRGVPDCISFHLSLRRMDSTCLSTAERYGLIEILGEGASLALFARIVETSTGQLSLTRMGRQRLSSYFPNLRQSFTEWVAIEG